MCTSTTRHVTSTNAECNAVAACAEARRRPQDARALLKALAGCDVPCPNPGGEAVVAAPTGFDHVIMNLPASAVQFLGAPWGSKLVFQV